MTNEYYLDHRSDLLAYFKHYNLVHRSELLEYKKQYSLAHRSERLDYFKRYNLAHRSKRLAYAKRYNKAHRIPLGIECEFCGSSVDLRRHLLDLAFPTVFMTVCRECYGWMRR